LTNLARGAAASRNLNQEDRKAKLQGGENKKIGQSMEIKKATRVSKKKK